MEENNNNEEQVVQEQEKKHICFKNHCWKMCLGMVVATFLGSFLATYFVADQIMQRRLFQYTPPIIHHQPFEDLEKMNRNSTDDLRRFFDILSRKNIQSIIDYEDEWERDFDDDFDRNLENHFNRIGKKPFEMPHFMSSAVKIKTDIDNDKYDVIINLKPFQNDESRINYNIQGKKLTVFGKSEIKEKNRSENIAFTQDFLLPENADTMNIQKQKDGNKLVISVPLKK